MRPVRQAAYTIISTWLDVESTFSVQRYRGER